MIRLILTQLSIYSTYLSNDANKYSRVYVHANQYNEKNEQIILLMFFSKMKNKIIH